MALSNIFQEPRREITESMVGIAVFSAVMGADYGLAVWFHAFTAPMQIGACPIPLGMVFGFIAMLLGVACIFITHAIGESACAALARRGIELRPQQRYNR